MKSFVFIKRRLPHLELCSRSVQPLKRFNFSAAFEVEAKPAPGSPFHLALPVHDMSLGKLMLYQMNISVDSFQLLTNLYTYELLFMLARHFYGGVLGLKEGRRSESKWQDYSLYGHQIVCHYVGSNYRCVDHFNPVDGDEVKLLTFPHVLSL